MGARWLIAMLLVGGCDVVYGLHDREKPIIDAAVADADAEIDAPLADMMIDAPMCPMNYGPIVGAPVTSVYKVVVETGRRWIYALDECRNDTPTGITHLVVFDDVSELEAIQDALPPIAPSFLSWVGYGRDYVGQPLKFRSVTNVALNQTSNLWNGGEPDNGNGTGAETVVWIANNNNGLVDAKTSDPVGGYVCECDFIPTVGFEFNVDP